MSLKTDKNQEFFMKKALKQAEKAFHKSEVPVGALIVRDKTIISRACNLREKKQNPLGHAEILAIKKASRKLNSWRLEGCSLYVTLEPCLMCIGAVLQARISELIYGCLDPKTGFSSYYGLDKQKNWNHKIKIQSLVCVEESSRLLKDFFKALRV